MKRLNIFLLSFFFPLHMYSDNTIPINSIMSHKEMQETGIQKLSPAEKKHLESWITNWTTQVVQQAPNYHPAKTIPEWVADWPPYARPIQKNTSSNEQKTLDEERSEANQVISKVRNDGEFIELKNGSVWLISPYDRHKTRRWQRDDVIQFSKTQNVWRPYRLKNITRIQVADAEMKEPPSPSGEAPKEPNNYYAGTVGVANVLQRGARVRLQDGSTWEIAPADQVRTREWKAEDRIRVKKRDSYLYTYSLSNLDSGETVLANDSK